MYLTMSTDAGNSFSTPQKLGNGNWELDGCPMDGGALMVDKNETVQTIWRREKKIYVSMPGMAEKEIGEGRNCTIASLSGKNLYAWIENGEVIITYPGGKKNLGPGSQPVLQGITDNEVLCVWENEKQIHHAIVKL